MCLFPISGYSSEFVRRRPGSGRQGLYIFQDVPLVPEFSVGYRWVGTFRARGGIVSGGEGVCCCLI